MEAYAPDKIPVKPNESQQKYEMRQTYNERIKSKICREMSCDTASSKGDSVYQFINKPETLQTPQMQSSNPMSSTINTSDAIVDGNIRTSKSQQRAGLYKSNDYGATGDDLGKNYKQFSLLVSNTKRRT